MARTKRKTDKETKFQANKRIFLGKDEQEESSLGAEKLKSALGDISAGERDAIPPQLVNYILNTYVNKVVFKSEEEAEVLTEEENCINVLAKEYESSDELADEYSDCDESSHYDEQGEYHEYREYNKYSEYNNYKSLSNPKNNYRESSTASESSYLSEESASPDNIPPPFLPIYHTVGVSLHDPYKGIDLQTVIIPPFSTHWQKNTFPNGTDNPPITAKIDAALYHQREAEMISLFNGPLIVAARRLSASVSLNTPSVFKHELQ